VRNVPDMLDATANVMCDAVRRARNSSGCMTSSTRTRRAPGCSFYHDHAMGITRLNVYSGEAAAT